MNTISELLVNYRAHYALTQQNLVERLSTYCEEFRHINTVTVSRWETGATSPSLKKKKHLLHFLAKEGCFRPDTECYHIFKRAYGRLYTPLSGIFTRNYQYLIGNFPEFKLDESHIHHLNTFEERDAHIEHIIDIETATNVPGYYSLGPNQLKKLCEHPSSFAIVCERKRQHLGHFVMFKIKNSVAEKIVRHHRNEYGITFEDLCAPTQKGTYYVHALYGKNPKIAALLNVQAYLHLFEQMQAVENVMIFSSRKDGMLLTRDYGIELIDKGKDSVYGFEWHGLMSPVEDILFSDTIVKLIF